MSPEPEVDRPKLHVRAAELDYIEAIKYLRAQTRCSLKDGMNQAKRIAADHPGSPLAAAVRRLETRNRRLIWAAVVAYIGIIVVAYASAYHLR